MKSSPKMKNPTNLGGDVGLGRKHINRQEEMFL